MDPTERGHVHVRLPIPQHDDRRSRRRVGLVLVLLALAGCTSPPAEDEAEALLESASIADAQGTIAIGDAFLLLEARLSVAPGNQAAEGTPGRAVALSDPPEVARTALLRDHWVLEGTLRERTPGAAVGLHRVRLDWNGELVGSLFVEGSNATQPLGVVARFDVGETIERSNVYAFEIVRMP